jgi:host factor-I protein
MNKDGGSVNIQDSYLGRACRERAWLTVHLNGGKRLTGRIRSFDRYTLILEDRGSEQMIFKHAIATISMSRTFSNAIKLGEGGKGKKPAPKEATATPARPGGGDATEAETPQEPEPGAGPEERG